jgi:EAL domain-containing protein (putative c-di-GMP-specific phosphodiesterase class I)
MNAGIDLAMAVNISARDLHDLNLPDRLANLLARWSVPADRLVLEITEHEIMRDRLQAAETLDRLAAMGVRVSIDDFGTGYSSLADLRHLPIDEIKIDRSFVSDMATDVNDAVIVRSIVDLGHNLGINVVAEGVENEEICTWLDELGCDEIQGFHICHPLPAGDLRRWLEQRHAGNLATADVIDLDSAARTA